MRRTNILEIRTLEECRAVLAQEFAIVFKHSKFCGVSHDAYQTICDFCADNPTFVVYLISVTDFLEVCGFVAAQTGIPHRSPQVLAMQNGIVMRHASHQKITHDFLKTLTQA